VVTGTWHVLFTQTLPPVHGALHAPQWLVLVFVSMQVSPASGTTHFTPASVQSRSHEPASQN
jgi:hypothetical protein